jgi:hypothetical protein
MDTLLAPIPAVDPAPETALADFRDGVRYGSTEFSSPSFTTSARAFLSESLT